MPTFSNYSKFIFVNVGFVALIAIMMYFRSAVDIKENWPLYRCNPPYWIFSEDISKDFTYCVQNTQINIMGDLLQPITYLISSLTNVGGELTSNVNGIRKMLSAIRGFTTEAIQNVFGVFLNIVIEFQRMTISVKDMVGKMIGMVVTMMYILDGSIKTMSSAWAGPNGQLVRALGSCFHPNTHIKLENGTICKMKDVKVGSILDGGGVVHSKLNLANLNNEKYYAINGGVNDEKILVTGNHFVLEPKRNRYVQVKYFGGATLAHDIKPDYELCCLITTNKIIKIGKVTFWDWEDDELRTKNDSGGWFR